MTKRSAEHNRNAVSRSNFHRNSAWKWVQRNYPAVARAIRDEAQKHWPSPINSKLKEAKDYSFVEKLVAP